MNIRKVGKWNKDNNTIQQVPYHYKNNKFSYWGRGRGNRIKRIGMCRLINGYNELAKNLKRFVKRYNTHNIKTMPIYLNEAE